MINYDLSDNVAILSIDDGKANAVSHNLIDTMLESLDRAESEASAVIIQGREGLFSAGFDLKEIQKGPDAATALVNRGAHMLLRMFSYPLPLIGACTGHAVAAGAFMLLSCDTRIGIGGNFNLGLNETAIGMTLPVFGQQLAKNRLSKRHLTAAVIQARMFSPQAAQDAGFLDRVVEAGDLMSACITEAHALSELPQATYAAMKRDTRAEAIAAIEASLS